MEDGGDSCKSCDYMTVENTFELNFHLNDIGYRTV